MLMGVRISQEGCFVIKALMLGAGHTPLERKLSVTEEPVDRWISLDMNEDAKPDILFSLNLIEQGCKIPNEAGYDLAGEIFDEIHAYDVIEHYGQQGDYKGFFRGFKELWRILKPGGMLYGICPKYSSDWAWGDPGHTRVITQGTLCYLTRQMYKDLGDAPQTDYRRFVDPCWWIVAVTKETEYGLQFALRKDK